MFLIKCLINCVSCNVPVWLHQQELVINGMCIFIVKKV
jgi:hypothetical protein